MLEIKNLHVRGGAKEILRGINFRVEKGQVHAIMGPNGSGKSTLARAISGHPECEVTAGSITYDGRDLLEMAPEDRAREGVFMAFQYPVEIPGVNNAYFLKAAINAQRQHRGLPELDAMEFMTLVKEKANILHLDPTLLSRPVNEGFCSSRDWPFSTRPTRDSTSMPSRRWRKGSTRCGHPTVRSS
jgi:Fe-S cluster assembly ATP-binding protein